MNIFVLMLFAGLSLNLLTKDSSCTNNKDRFAYLPIEEHTAVEYYKSKNPVMSEAAIINEFSNIRKLMRKERMQNVKSLSHNNSN